MKKSFYLILFIILLFPLCVCAEEKELIKNATSGLLMEASTGEIIYEKEEDKKVSVASMTKMVAQIIILENIEEKKIKWTDVVTVSKNASDMGGSQIYLAANEKMTVKDLFKGISMASANDATVAMAEYIAGSEDKFVVLMNKKVKEMGLKNTVFKNCTGLDEDGHYSTSYDMAVIARNLLLHDEILKFSSVYEDYLRVNTPNKFWLVNTNKLIRSYNGSDGLKTGHTDNSKYCIAATAKRNNMRLIAVVLGEENATIRNKETSELLDYGFNTKQVKVIKKKSEVVKKLSLEQANKKYIKIYPKEDVLVLQDKGVRNNNYKTKVKIDKIKLPLKKDDVVGTTIVYYDNKKIRDVSLVVRDNIEKQTFLKLFLDKLKNISVGVIYK